MVLVGVRSGFQGFQGILGGFQGSFRWVSKGVLSGLQELKRLSTGCQARFSGASRHFRRLRWFRRYGFLKGFLGIPGGLRRGFLEF